MSQLRCEFVLLSALQKYAKRWTSYSVSWLFYHIKIEYSLMNLIIENEKSKMITILGGSTSSTEQSNASS